MNRQLTIYKPPSKAMVPYVKPMTKKPYYKKKTNTVAKLNKKVNMLMKKKRPEIKRQWMASPVSSNVGQVNANGSGILNLDISSCMSIGAAAGVSDRIGNQATLTGILLRFQLQQQSALAIGVRYILEVFKTDDLSTAIGSLPAKLYEVDSISGVYDYNSSRTTIYRKVYKRVYSKSFYLPADTISSVSGFIDKKLFIKQQQLLEWPGASTSNPQNVRYFVTVRASGGNLSTTTASTLPLIPLTAVNTGATCALMATAYFVDY